MSQYNIHWGPKVFYNRLSLILFHFHFYLKYGLWTNTEFISYYILYSYYIIYCIHIVYCSYYILYCFLPFFILRPVTLSEFRHCTSLCIRCTILCLLSVQSLKKLQRDMVTYTKVKILCTCSVLKLYSLTWQTIFSYPLFSNMTSYKCFIS